MRLAFLSVLALVACTPSQEAVTPVAVARPETVSVLAGSTSDADAQRLCGGPARPETVHHESNVITYRCLGGAN
ncbi:MAG: hypothetical protein R3C27_02490 [Hyphomonadaceae bacterium]